MPQSLSSLTIKLFSTRRFLLSLWTVAGFSPAWMMSLEEHLYWSRGDKGTGTVSVPLVPWLSTRTNSPSSEVDSPVRAVKQTLLMLAKTKLPASVGRDH